jgi:hypothetical protein
VSGPAPLLDFFKKGEVSRDARLEAAQGGLAARAHEQLAILAVLVEDADIEIRQAAEATLARIPPGPLKAFLARADVSAGLRDFFAGRGINAQGAAPSESDDPLVGPAAQAAPAEDFDESDDRETAVQRIAKMGFTERLKAAMKGTREMRSILIRDPNKMIAAAVLSSPKLSLPEVESIARMTNVSDEVLRIIGNNRAWVKSYGVVLGLVKNPKTPLTMSMNFMARLTDRDLNQLSVDRNVPEPLRVAARKKVVSNTSGKT